MNLKKYLFLLTIVLTSLSSCSKEDDENDLGKFSPQTYNVSGKVEKGPFVSGSTITIQPMDANMQVLGNFYSTTIQDYIGNFSFGSKSFDTPYAKLVANGYFFNEVEGCLSSGTLNLQALVNLSDRTTVNVNILTHLKFQRILKLVAEGENFTEANKQAQKELFSAFGLQKYTTNDASSFSIISGTDESAALIAISSLLIVNKNEATITENLAKLCKEFGKNGYFSKESKKQIKKDKAVLYEKLSDVKSNIIERYRKFGIDVKIKDLVQFFDWDNDGIVGNEILEDGQKIELEKTELRIPNEGGEYRINIVSPIPVYLEQKIGKDLIPSNITETNSLYNNFYEDEDINDTNIFMHTELNNNILSIKISKLNSRTSKTGSIFIYDVIGNELGKIEIQQEGNKDLSLPKLGTTGKDLINNFTSSLSEAFYYLNIIEQYYQTNNKTNLLSRKITPNSNLIGSTFSKFYVANRKNLTIIKIDSEKRNIYQNYNNTFLSLYYYYMVVAWGNLPYIFNYDCYQNLTSNGIASTSQYEILDKLKTLLNVAIENLEEKKNESLKGINDYFFLSKDVARILLADIYMYQNNYINAESLLATVIDNGFYSLDTSNYSYKTTIDNLYNNGSSSETIFATKYQSSNLVNEEISRPSVIPVMNYTDVILSYAECLYKNGKKSEAQTYLNEVISAKNIKISGNNILTKIKDARMQLLLYSNSNFAFLKRNHLAKDEYSVEEYQLLLPIPESEVYISNITQNPGY